MTAARDELLKGLTAMAVARGWHDALAKWGRSGEQTLLAHAVDVFGVASVLLDAWQQRHREVTEQEERAILAAAFTHDWEKASPAFQAAVSSHSDDADEYHHAVLKDPADYQQSLAGAGLTPREAEVAAAILPRAPALEDAAHKLAVLQTGAADGWMARLVWTADRLVSLKGVPPVHPLGPRVEEVLARDFGLQADWHAVGMVRGLVTQLLHQAAEAAFAREGWKPALRSATGTLYLGPVGTNLPAVSAIEAELVRVLVEFYQTEAVQSQLGPRAFGGLTATVITSPEFLFFSQRTVADFWRSVLNMRSLQADQTARVKPELLELVRARDLAPDEPTARAAAAEATAGTWALIVLKSVVSLVTEGRDVLNRMAQESFGMDDAWNTIRSLAHTSGLQQRLETWLKWRAVLGHAGEASVQVDPLKRLEEFCMDVSLALQSAGAVRHPLVPRMKAVAQALMGDLTRPGRVDVDRIRDLYAAYTRPKARGSNLCPLCSGAGDVQDRYLEGAESFSNFLAAGAPLGGPNKRRICRICEVETKLRSLVLDEAAEVLIIVPQVTLSPSGATYWGTTLGQLLEGIETSGFQALNQVETMARQVLRGMDGQTEEALAALTAGPERQRRRLIKDFLESSGWDLEDWATEHETTVRSWAEAAEAVINRPEAVLKPGELRELREYLRRRAGVAITPVPPRVPGPAGWGAHYLMIQIRQGLGARDEAESASQLRRLFVGLYLAHLFRAAVIFPDHPFAPVSGRIEGAVCLRMKVSVRTLLGLGSGTISHQDVGPLLKRLAGLISANELLVSKRADYGEAGLLKLARTPVGEVLQRHLLKAKFPDPQLLECLELWKGAKEHATDSAGSAEGPGPVPSGG